MERNRHLATRSQRIWVGIPELVVRPERWSPSDVGGAAETRREDTARTIREAQLEGNLAGRAHVAPEDARDHPHVAAVSGYVEQRAITRQEVHASVEVDEEETLEVGGIHAGAAEAGDESQMPAGADREEVVQIVEENSRTRSRNGIALPYHQAQRSRPVPPDPFDLVVEVHVEGRGTREGDAAVVVDSGQVHRRERMPGRQPRGRVSWCRVGYRQRAAYQETQFPGAIGVDRAHEGDAAARQPGSEHDVAGGVDAQSHTIAEAVDAVGRTEADGRACIGSEVPFGCEQHEAHSRFLPDPLVVQVVDARTAEVAIRDQL